MCRQWCDRASLLCLCALLAEHSRKIHNPQPRSSCEASDEDQPQPCVPPPWSCASCCSCSSPLCALPRGVTALIPHGVLVQAGTGTAGGVGAAKQGTEGSLGRICVNSAVLHPLGGTLKMPNTIPSARYGDQRTFGACNSFPEILNSYCNRKKIQCLSRETSPNPSGREGSFCSCFYPYSLSHSLPWFGMLLLTPLC